MPHGMSARAIAFPEPGSTIEALTRRPDAASLRRYADEFAERALLRVALYVLAALLHGIFFSAQGAVVGISAILTAEGLRLWEVAAIRRGVARRRPRLMGAITWIAPSVHALAASTVVVVAWTAPVEPAASRLFALVLAMAFAFDASFTYAANRRGVAPQIAILTSLSLALVGGSVLDGGITALVALELFTLLLFTYIFLTYAADAASFRRGQVAITTALKQANAELSSAARENERLALISQHATDGIVILSPDGFIEWTNPSYAALCGHPAEALIGAAVGTLASETNDPAMLDRVRSAVRRGVPIREQVLIRHRDGRDVWIDAAMTPIRGDCGEVTGYISVERDISQQKAHEAQLAEAQRTAEAAASAKADFLATMSHEIRTPLNGVLGTADLLREGVTDPDQALLVETITGSAEYLMRIIDNVLQAAKLDAGADPLEEQPFDLHLLVTTSAELLRPVASRKGLALILDIADRTPETVVGDAARVRQIVLNLLGNALKFTETGEVRLRVGAAPTEGGSRIAIAVTDTGIGIPPGRQQAVFENFTQADRDTARRFGGTGLGLAISRKLARQMGGEIVVQSIPGAGTTFTATLLLGLQPKAEERPAPDRTAAAASDAGEVLEVRGADPKPPRLLVVDDNKTNRFVIEKMLAGTRYALRLAEEGQEAIAAAAEWHPDLILMDISMPGMDGFEACRAIRRDEAARGAGPSRILALSANAARPERRAAGEAGMDGFIAKPVRKASLIEAIEEALASPCGAAPRGTVARPVATAAE